VRTRAFEGEDSCNNLAVSRGQVTRIADAQAEFRLLSEYLDPVHPETRSIGLGVVGVRRQGSIMYVDKGCCFPLKEESRLQYISIIRPTSC
jgi:hypothetical protein